MPTKIIVPTAERHLDEIYSFIRSGNPEAARRYAIAARQCFKEASETPLHRRASENLPDYIREMPVPGFKGYTLRVAYVDDKIGLVAAFRPGFTDAMKNRRTHSGVRELKRS